MASNQWARSPRRAASAARRTSSTSNWRVAQGFTYACYLRVHTLRRGRPSPLYPTYCIPSPDTVYNCTVSDRLFLCVLVASDDENDPNAAHAARVVGQRDTGGWAGGRGREELVCRKKNGVILLLLIFMSPYVQ